MLYVMDSSEKRDRDIGGSSAVITLSVPRDGSVAEINVPFKTMDEENNQQYKSMVPSNWAALCLFVETNAAGKDELRIVRLNALSVFQPNSSKLCGSSKGKV